MRKVKEHIYILESHARAHSLARCKPHIERGRTSSFFNIINLRRFENVITNDKNNTNIMAAHTATPARKRIDNKINIQNAFK